MAVTSHSWRHNIKHNSLGFVEMTEEREWAGASCSTGALGKMTLDHNMKAMTGCTELGRGTLRRWATELSSLCGAALGMCSGHSQNHGSDPY